MKTDTSNYNNQYPGPNEGEIFDGDWNSDDYDPDYSEDIGIRCQACYGTGLDRYEDVDCMTCWGEGVVYGSI